MRRGDSHVGGSWLWKSILAARRSSLPAIDRQPATVETTGPGRPGGVARNRVAHDFAPFAPESYTRSTRRRALRAGVRRRRALVTFTIEASSFLPHQVRNTMGGLIRVGLHKMSVEEFHGEAIRGKAGTMGPTAPPRGLCLMHVRYRGFPPSEEIS